MVLGGRRGAKTYVIGCVSTAVDQGARGEGVTDPIEVINAGTCCEVDDETRRLLLLGFVSDDPLELEHLLRSATCHVIILQTAVPTG